MSRFVFVVPPLTGHVNPAVGIAGELARRGHDVTFAAHANIVGPLLPPDLPLLPLPVEITDDEREEIEHRARKLRGPASLKFLWQEFLIPLGESMVTGVSDVVDAFRPDVVVADQQAIGGAVVARRRGVPWATLATTSAEFDDPYDVLAGVGEWVRERLAEFASAQGLAPGGPDVRFSDQLTLITSVAELLKTPAGHPDHYAFVGATTGWRRPADDFPYEWIDGSRKLLLVSLGTVTREIGGRFLGAVARAVAPMSEQVLAVVVAPPGLVADPPDNVLVVPYIPQLELLDGADAVVSHSGNNTVCESLSRGVPMVVAPVRDDQPIIAEQVVRSGAGVRVRFGRVSPEGVGEAIRAVLGDESYRAAAARLRAAFEAAGGAPSAANHLEKLA